MEKNKIVKHLDKALDKQVPDMWEELHYKISKSEETGKKVRVIPSYVPPFKRKMSTIKKVSIAAAICLLTVSTLTLTPVGATIQEMYDKLFSSEHIDDTGLKAAITEGHGQVINQTYYDKKQDITVHFQTIMTDDKETKLLLTFQSKKTNLEDYHLDIFEGYSQINLVDKNGTKKRLNHVGWGSRYYDKKENKVVEALSFESVKEYQGQEISLEVENLTIYVEGVNGSKKIVTTWPLQFALNDTGVSTRETIELNKEFTFSGETYMIQQVEFSDLETRVVVTGTDTGPVEENGELYDVMSKLEAQLLNARKFDKELGYVVVPNKSGVFLKSSGEKVEPIFSKNELPAPLGTYVMVFAPVKDRQNTVLEVGDEIKVPLTK